MEMLPDSYKEQNLQNRVIMNMIHKSISISQTIVQSYGEFLAAGGVGGNRSIMSSLPPPANAAAAAESVLGTRDLSDDNDYLFAPSSGSSGATPV